MCASPEETGAPGVVLAYCTVEQGEFQYQCSKNHQRDSRGSPEAAPILHFSVSSPYRSYKLHVHEPRIGDGGIRIDRTEPPGFDRLFVLQLVSVDLRIYMYRAFFRTQAMNAEHIDNLDNIGTKTQTRD